MYIIQSSPSIVIPDIVTSLPISTFALVQVTNKLIKKNLSLVTSYSIFIITPFFFGPKGCDYKGGRLYLINNLVKTRVITDDTLYSDHKLLNMTLECGDFMGRRATAFEKR